jgi:hypothetical protein
LLASLAACVANNSHRFNLSLKRKVLGNPGLASSWLLIGGWNYSPFQRNSWEPGDKFVIWRSKLFRPRELLQKMNGEKIQPRFARRPVANCDLKQLVKDQCCHVGRGS